jgi:sarcosine oxidase subunit beta
MRAIAMWPTLADELQADLDYHQHGHLTFVADESDLPEIEQRVAEQRAAGLGIEMLYGDALREVAPGASPSLIAGAYCPTDGHANPIYTTKAFARAAVREGARLREWTPVTGLVTDSGCVRGVETSDGTVEADWVVNAAGAWSPRICEMAGFSVPIEAVAPQMMLTSPLPHALDPVVGCVGKALSLKQLSHGQYLIGGGWPATVYMDRTRPIGMNRQGSITGSAEASSSVWPVLLQSSVVRVWSGLEAETSDVVPILGPVPQVEGFLMASGFSGHGFALSPYIGVLIAEQIVNGSTPIPLDSLSIQRFAV